MSTKNKWLLGIGITLGLIMLFFLPSLWQAFFPSAGFGMMNHSNMGMMNQVGSFPMHGGMGTGVSFLWFFALVLLALIGLVMAALIKYLRSPSV